MELEGFADSGAGDVEGDEGREVAVPVARFGDEACRGAVGYGSGRGVVEGDFAREDDAGACWEGGDGFGFGEGSGGGEGEEGEEGGG